MIFAAQLPDPQSAQALGWVALALFSIIGGINQALKFFDRFKERPPGHTIYATKAEHAELAQRFEAMRVEFDRSRTELTSKIEDNFRALDHKRSVSIAGLHDDINKLGTGLNDRFAAVIEKVGELRGKVNSR